MTPASYSAHVRAFRRKERRLQSRAAMLASILVNANRGKNTAPVHMRDFMAGLDDEEGEEC